jgi:hypothetical protein
VSLAYQVYPLLPIFDAGWFTVVAGEISKKKLFCRRLRSGKERMGIDNGGV